jgi:hypothetical protein
MVPVQGLYKEGHAGRLAGGAAVVARAVILAFPLPLALPLPLPPMLGLGVGGGGGGAA